MIYVCIIIRTVWLLVPRLPATCCSCAVLSRVDRKCHNPLKASAKTFPVQVVMTLYFCAVKPHRGLCRPDSSIASKEARRWQKFWQQQTASRQVQQRHKKAKELPKSAQGSQDQNQPKDADGSEYKHAKDKRAKTRLKEIILQVKIATDKELNDFKQYLETEYE